MNANEKPAEVTINRETGRVYVGARSVGYVRRNRAGETVHMGGRVWVAEDRAHSRIAGTFTTATEAARALAIATGFLKP